MVERFREWRVRRLLPLTHEQYLDEPAETLDWFLAFDEQDRKLQAEAERRAAARRGR